MHGNQLAATVKPNTKCGRCLHYAPNEHRAGLCMIGLQPLTCGSGDMPRIGFAPMDLCNPEDVDSIVTGVPYGTPGQMNEFGQMEQQLKVPVVDFGSEALTAAYVAYDKAKTIAKSHCLVHQGVSFDAVGVCRCPSVSVLNVVKSVFPTLSPAVRTKFAHKDYITFLQANGLDLDETSMTIRSFHPQRRS